MGDYRVEELLAPVPVGEFLETCVDVKKFEALCRQCPNYGKIWACPPLGEDPLALWREYETLELHARVLIPGESMGEKELMEAFREEKLRLSRKVLNLEKNHPGSRSMAASTCLQCSPCQRVLGRPCLHPEQLRYSIEALGGDVGKLMEVYLHRPIQWIRQGILPPYLTIVAGLLLKKQDT